MIAKRLVTLKDEIEQVRDEYAEKIYWPLINAILVTVYTSIGKRKLEGYNDQNVITNKKITGFEAEKNECNGKIEVLREVKSRIKPNSVKDESTVLDKTKKGEKEDKGIMVNGEIETAKATKEGDKFEEIKKQIIDDSNTVVENMKVIENEQESNFQEFLKKLGSVLINQKTLRNYKK